MSNKKFIVIDRNKCIGCGSCVIASEGKCDFVNGKVWAEKVEVENIDEIIDVCPVEAISAGDSDTYDATKKKFNL